MAAKDCDSRKDKILELVIENYINTAVPIASRTISRKLRLGLSSATIRNVMSDLEEAGLITHPHTSAGRIPTEKGYRYYINRLMQAKLLTEEEKKNIDKEFKAKMSELDDILNKASNILSSITNQTGVVLFPILKKSQFKHVELIKFNKNKLLIVLLTESGFTKDFVININDGVESSDVLRISNFINSQIDKGSLNNIRKEIMHRLLAERNSFFYVLEQAKELIDSVLDMIKEDKLYLDGMARIAEQPEFSDINKLKHIYKIMEDEDLLLSIFKKDSDEEGIKVCIGSEIGNEFLECSLIASNYCIGDISCGTLGIIGPTRMEYARLVSVVGYVASTLSRALSE